MQLLTFHRDSDSENNTGRVSLFSTWKYSNCTYNHSKAKCRRQRYFWDAGVFFCNFPMFSSNPAGTPYHYM